MSLRQRIATFRQKLIPMAEPQFYAVHADPRSWCATHLPLYAPPNNPLLPLIEARAHSTNAQGAKPLWEGYAQLKDYPTAVGDRAARSADQVRTQRAEGRLFSWLAATKRPQAILEFGTAFGVSGMFWLAGLEAAQTGHLYTFEPNTIWAALARENLAAISNRFTLTTEIFEMQAPRLLREAVPVDIAFIDAIHTHAFVDAQLALVRTLTRPGALIILDDIDFSDDMRACWRDVSQREGYAAAYRFGNRLGILEVAS